MDDVVFLSYPLSDFRSKPSKRLPAGMYRTFHYYTYCTGSSNYIRPSLVSCQRRAPRFAGGGGGALLPLHASSLSYVLCTRRPYHALASSWHDEPFASLEEANQSKSNRTCSKRCARREASPNNTRGEERCCHLHIYYTTAAHTNTA